jgi:succinyl-diaminopimelate desuccinylase
MFNWRYSPESTREALVARLESVLHRHAVDYELEFPSSGKPYLTPRGRLVDVASEAVHEVCGRVPALSCTGGTSDGRFLADICREVVELGPVNATIHKIDERVSVAELDALSAVYRRILDRLLA